MSRASILRAAGRAYGRLSQDFPGTIQFSGATPIAASVEIGTQERAARDGGFVRIRSASVWVPKASLPAAPDFRTPVILTKAGCDPERFQVFEHHDQIPGYWFLRCAQWGESAA